MFRAMKHVFIVNPAAGKSDRTESYRKLIDAAFVPRGLPVSYTHLTLPTILRV